MKFDESYRVFGRWHFVPKPEAQGLPVSCVEWVSHEILDGITLNANLKSGQFWIETLEEETKETLDHCLYDLIVPRLLAHDGNLVIHGGLSFGQGGAVGFIGPSGRGKSTLVAGLHTIGMMLMGDDAFILNPTQLGYDAQRIYASLRLFPDSLGTFFSEDHETTLVADYSSKRRVPFEGGPEDGPLVALFQLAEPEPDIRVRKLSMAESCMAIVSNSFVLDVDNIEETKVKFGLASTASQSIPIYDLHYPRDYKKLPEVYDIIRETIENLPVGSEGSNQ